LERLLEVPRHQLLRAVEELDDRGLIEASVGRLSSSHALLSDAVVRQMSSSVRRVLHGAAAALLQSELGPSESGRLPWDCAEHWRQAGNDAQAMLVLRKCARRALEIGRPTDALATCRRALDLTSSDGARLELVEQSLDTFWSGINFVEAVDLLAELKRLRARIGLPAVAHDAYEVLEFASVLHSDRDPRINIPRLRDCVVAGTATPQHRLACAQQLIMIADLTIDPELARFAYDATSNIAGEDDQRIFCDFIYHACFGDVSVVRTLADPLNALKFSKSRLHLAYLLNIGYARYRIGSFDEAKQNLLDALCAARRNEMRAAEAYALLFLAQLCWSTYWLDECRIWHHRLTELFVGGIEPSVICDHCILGARIALQDGDFESAKQFIGRARERIQASLDLPRMLLGACEIEVLLATDPQSCTDRLLSDLRALHERARCLGSQDEVVTALVRALNSKGRSADAAGLLNVYFRDRRRDGVPMRHELAELARGQELAKTWASSAEAQRSSELLRNA
jgi:tetratricopeptide (TPR) repeat protein